jgi:hypothetical protein
MIVRISVVHEGQAFSGEVELHPVRRHQTLERLPAPSSSAALDRARKPSAAIELLYQAGFFKEARRLPDVSDKLREAGYNFSRQAVFMALKAAEFLALTGRRGAYRFVQKFPPET